MGQGRKSVRKTGGQRGSLASEAREACRALGRRTAGSGGAAPAGSMGRAPGGGEAPGIFLKNKGVLEALRAILSIETSTKLMSNFHEKYDIRNYSSLVPRVATQNKIYRHIL